MRNQGFIKAGARDVQRAAQTLAARLPPPLAPLSTIAYNYRWSWDADGDRIFREIDPYRWPRCGQNPVLFLIEAPSEALERAALDRDLVRRAERLADLIDEDVDAPAGDHGISDEHPVAFFCAEFGVHRSLPVYAGGLGGLAGDLLKAASDARLPFVGVGILYRQGYFHQRIDASGWQHEYWHDIDPDFRPAARVTDPDDGPVEVHVPIWGQDVWAQVWRVNVGRVPLFLLDTQIERNSPRAKFISGRLYESNPEIRLAQYALLGVGGYRLLQALGIDPSLIHLNEGHPALATLQMVRDEIREGAGFDQAVESTRNRFVFTTHTPVAAGNETYPVEEVNRVFPDMAERWGAPLNELLGLARVDASNGQERPSTTVLGLRMSRKANGVSRVHGAVARQMWAPLYPGRSPDAVPIGHVTNGAHLPTWMHVRYRELFDRYLEKGWEKPDRLTHPETWSRIDDIPDEEIWATRNAVAEELCEWVRSRSVRDRLTRGDSIEYAEQISNALRPDHLIVGFARRVATYKRLHLITLDPQRALRLIGSEQAVQFLFAGKAHPKDDGAKRVLQNIFSMKGAPHVGEHVAFIEDYDMSIAARLVSGCDVWLNLPRPPLEASGTSGMKAAFNFTINLSVLDGWWAEAYDGENGWAIEARDYSSEQQRDAADSAALYDLLEKQVVPSFYDRNESGLPVAWLQRARRSLKTAAARFCAARMLRDYVEQVYRP